MSSVSFRALLIMYNTYWSCIVPIGIFINLASNVILLGSKKCFLTSQGLVGASMNCRALFFTKIFTFYVDRIIGWSFTKLSFLCRSNYWMVHKIFIFMWIKLLDGPSQNFHISCGSEIQDDHHHRTKFPHIII